MSVIFQYLRALVLLIAAEQSVIVLSDPDKTWIKSVLNHAFSDCGNYHLLPSPEDVSP